MPGIDRVVLRGGESDVEVFRARFANYGRSVDDLPLDDQQKAVFSQVLTGTVRAREYSPRAPAYSAESDSRPVGFRVGHGTAIADLAAGYPADQGPVDRPIVAVELPDYVIADTNGARLEVFVLMAVRRILNWVDAWETGRGPKRVPVVINISLGNSAGPRNGSGFLEKEVARLVDARNKAGIATKVVLAAGNNYRSRMAGLFELMGGQSETVEWVVPPGDKSPSFLEIRVPRSNKPDITISGPGLASLAVNLNGAHDLTEDGQKIGRVYTEIEGARRVITLALAATAPLDKPDQAAPAGVYRVAIFNPGPSQIDVAIDVQRDDSLDGWPSYGRQSYLDHPLLHLPDPETRALDLPDKHSPVKRRRTLSAYATNPSNNVFSVGGAFGSFSGHPALPTLYTSSGPSAGKVASPDLAAVTEEGRATPGRLATGFLSGSAVVISGTSCAAPQLTRALVKMLVKTAKNPSKSDVLRKLLGTALPQKPNLRLGQGVLLQKVQPGRVQRRRVV
jgi:hypothetical protein